MCVCVFTDIRTENMTKLLGGGVPSLSQGSLKS